VEYRWIGLKTPVYRGIENTCGRGVDTDPQMWDNGWTENNILGEYTCN
jgi:hypothetical protein